ncbi:hypothetical protein BSP239C_00651 [Brevibacterium sp. 239c]|nr:hypothetical protein BSP239C_00651 [Brevibacterium sp. 239c]
MATNGTKARTAAPHPTKTAMMAGATKLLTGAVYWFAEVERRFNR